MSSNKSRVSTPRRSSGIGVGASGVNGSEGGGMKRNNSSSSIALLKVEVPSKLGNDSSTLGSASSSTTTGGSKANLSKLFAASSGGAVGSSKGLNGNINSGGPGSVKVENNKPGGIDLEGIVFPTDAGNSREKKEAEFIGMNEKILNDICSLYTEKELLGTAKAVRAEVTIPKRQVVVLLVGNHSAGKSSFINWYVQDSIMKTGVAIETQGINFILHGSRRETLKGSATLQLFPELGKLRDIPGVVANMMTEVSPSRARMFESVVFIDTPGLVDGNMNYPFDINKTLLALGAMADLTFFFFEPIGQALCRRTVDILEEMWTNSYEARIRLFLAKADEAGGDSDRQKVMMQIIQELCKRPMINRSGFEMPAIYIPGISEANRAGGSGSSGGYVPFYASGRSTNSSKAPKCTNQIDETCKEIEKAVKMNVQNALDNLETDCDEVIKKLEEKLKRDDEAKRINSAAAQKKSIVWIAMVCIIICVLAENLTEELNFKSFTFVTKLSRPVRIFLTRLFVSRAGNGSGSNPREDFDLMPKITLNIVFGIGCFLYACYLFINMFFGNAETEMPKKDRQEIDRKLKAVVQIKSKQKTLYKSFLAQSIPDIMLGDSGSRDKIECKEKK